MVAAINSVDTLHNLASLRILQYSSDLMNSTKSYRILRVNSDVRKLFY
jgi:hypothetical protein